MYTVKKLIEYLSQFPDDAIVGIEIKPTTTEDFTGAFNKAKAITTLSSGNYVLSNGVFFTEKMKRINRNAPNKIIILG